MNEIMLKEKIANCASQDLATLVTEHRSELTNENIIQILEKVIAAYIIFVVRRLDKHALLKKEYATIVMKKCPDGHRAEVEFLFEHAY